MKDSSQDWQEPGFCEWAEEKVRWLFEQAGIPCPVIVVESTSLAQKTGLEERLLKPWH